VLTSDLLAIEAGFAPHARVPQGARDVRLEQLTDGVLGR
jgi:hypothetical protein